MTILVANMLRLGWVLISEKYITSLRRFKAAVGERDMATEGGRRRGFPWVWVISGALLAIAIGLIIYAFLPAAPPPYTG